MKNGHHNFPEPNSPNAKHINFKWHKPEKSSSSSYLRNWTKRMCTIFLPDKWLKQLIDYLKRWQLIFCQPIIVSALNVSIIFSTYCGEHTDYNSVSQANSDHWITLDLTYNMNKYVTFGYWKKTAKLNRTMNRIYRVFIGHAHVDRWFTESDCPLSHDRFT